MRKGAEKSAPFKVLIFLLIGWKKVKIPLDFCSSKVYNKDSQGKLDE